MNENLNLVEILKDCPKGTKLYSIVFGDIKFEKLIKDELYPIFIRMDDNRIRSFSADGKMYYGFGECVLFPSKDQRDWSKFTAPWLEKQGDSLRINDRAWLYLVSDVLTWKDGIGQYLDDPRVQELAKRLCSEYAQKLYNPSVLSNSSNTGKNEQKFDPKTLQAFDKVLVFDSDRPWTPLLFSYLEYSLNYPRMQCFDFAARKVIPYNKETEHLVGTYSVVPKYYRYWEE